MNFRYKTVVGLFFLLVIKDPSSAQCIPTGSSTLVNICSGNLPYVWNHISYNEPGNYSVRLTNAAGCDSMANLNLQINLVSSSGNINTCVQDFPFAWRGKMLPAPGVFMDTISNQLGCDSIIVLNLTASNTWMGGGGSNNWEDVNNWSCHVVPSVVTDVVINSGAVIVSSNQTVRSLTVAPGASFTVTPGFDFHITSASLSSAPVYLTKYIGHADYGNGAYQYVERHYYYDSLNRLTSVVSNVVQFPVGIGEPHSDYSNPDSLIYYYQQGDTLPYKAAHYNNGIYDPVEYYTYDNQTRISRRIQSSAEGFRIRYDYVYSANEIVITDTFGTVQQLVYDGNNVTNDNWGGNTTGFTMQHNNLVDPFSLVPVNKHMPYREGWITQGETYFNKNALSQTKATAQNPYQLDYEYDNIINGVPARAKLTLTNYNYTATIFQYFYYRQ